MIDFILQFKKNLFIKLILNVNNNLKLSHFKASGKHILNPLFGYDKLIFISSLSEYFQKGGVSQNPRLFQFSRLSEAKLYSRLNLSP